MTDKASKRKFDIAAKRVTAWSAELASLAKEEDTINEQLFKGETEFDLSDEATTTITTSLLRIQARKRLLQERINKAFDKVGVKDPPPPPPAPAP